MEGKYNQMGGDKKVLLRKCVTMMGKESLQSKGG